MGYIGLHTIVELLNAGQGINVLDNFCSNQADALAPERHVIGKQLVLLREAVRYQATLTEALRVSGAKAVIHFAG